MPEERDHKDIGAPRAAAAQPSLAYPVARHMGIASGESPLLLNFSAVLNIYVGIMMVPHAAKIAVQFVQEAAAPSFEHYVSSLFPVANISALELCINSCGHVYGAMVLHLLEVYASIKRLKLDIPKFHVISPSFCLIYILNFRQSCWRLGLYYGTSMTDHTSSLQFSFRGEYYALRAAPVFS